MCLLYQVRLMFATEHFFLYNLNNALASKGSLPYCLMA
jgi:hypothetical protein